MLWLALLGCSDPPPRYGVTVATVPFHVTDVLAAPVEEGAAPGETASTFPAVAVPGVPERERVRTVSLGREGRPALLATGGSRWVFAVPRDRDARLRVGTGVLEGELCFRVWIDAREAGERCAPAGKAWAPWLLPLPRADAPSEIVLESTGEGFGAWGDPRVLPNGEDPRPDVVLLVFDTTRWDHFGAAGYAARPTTPTLDAWLRGAITYTQARSASPWTAPSIGSALTGRWAPEHGAGARRVLGESLDALSGEERKIRGYARLLPDVPTLASALRGGGYETVALSSNGFFGSRSGLDQGYGRFLRYSGSRYAGAREGVRIAKDILEKRGDAPTFLTVHFIDPHHPYTMRLPPPSGFEVPSGVALDDASHKDKKAVEVRRVGREEKAHPDALRALYDAELRWLDDALADLLPSVPADALVVGLADHGEGFGEHGLFIHGNSLHDELLHVPLFVRWPGGTHGGARVDTNVSLVDVAPTVLGAVGLPLPAGLDGRALPLPGESAPERILFAEAMYDGGDETAAIDGRWKYVFQHPTGRGDRVAARGTETRSAPTERLYDLVADPGETTAVDAPDVIARLRGATFEHLATTWPGIHLRCRPGVDPLQVRATSDETLGRVGPLTTEAGDRIALAKRQTLALQLTADTPDDTDWFVLLLDRPGTLSFEAEGAWEGPTTVSYAGGPGDRAPAHPPADPPAPGGCQVWEVGAVGGEIALDEETRAELRELGYVE